MALLDDYLGWPREEQARFAVGARLGIYRRLAERDDPGRRRLLDEKFAGYRAPGADELLRAATALRARFI